MHAETIELVGADPRGASLKGRLYISFSVFMLTFLMLLFTFDKWAYNNDPINDLGTGYNIGGEDPDIRKFYDAAMANCTKQAADPEALSTCRGYQQVLLENVFGNYPIPTLFGQLIQYGYGSTPFLRQVSTAIVRVSIVGFLASVLLFLPLLWRMPPASAITIVVIVGVGGALSGLMRRSALDISVPTVTGTLAALVGLLAAGLLVAGALHGLERRRGRMGPSVIPSDNLVPLVIGLIGILVIGRMLGSNAVRAPFQLAALAAALALFLVAAAAGRIPVFIAAIMAVAMFAMVNDDYVLKLHTSRAQGFLVVAGILAYVTARPRGRLAWLMPATLLFHVASAGLMAIAIFLTESIVCIRRRRISPLLGASVATLIPACLFLLRGTVNPMTSVATVDLTGAIERAAASPALGAGLCAILLLLALAGIVLGRRDESWDGLGRILLLLAGVALASQISFMIDQNPTVHYAGGYFLLSTAHQYFVPAVCLGGILGLAALMAERIAGQPSSEEGASRRRGLWLTPGLAVLCLIVAKAPPLTMSKDLEGILNGPAMVFLGAEPLEWDELAIAAKDDDDYYLNAAKPINDALTYFSLLKLKVRKAAHRFNSSAMRVLVLEGGHAAPLTTEQ